MAPSEPAVWFLRTRIEIAFRRTTPESPRRSTSDSVIVIRWLLADRLCADTFDCVQARKKNRPLARRLAAASRDAFTALVDQAIGRRVAFLIIAGDVYDGAWKDTSIGLFFNRQVSRLIRAGIGVYTLRGNHDAASVVIGHEHKDSGAIRYILWIDGVLHAARDRLYRIPVLMRARHHR